MTEPMVTMTDEATGEQLTEEDMLNRLRAADPDRLRQEMMHHLHALLLPHSLFLWGSEFRYFVEKYNEVNDEPATVFTLGGKDFPLPQYWPDDPIHSVHMDMWMQRYMLDHPDGFKDADLVEAARVIDEYDTGLREYVALNPCRV